MLNDFRASEDGFTIRDFMRGEIYDVSNRLGRVFDDLKVCEVLDDSELIDNVVRPESDRLKAMNDKLSKALDSVAITTKAHTAKDYQNKSVDTKKPKDTDK